MYPHRIRLRGPWTYRTLETAEEGTIVPPGFWHHLGLRDYWGTVELKRGFNWVAGRQADERIVLELDQVAGAVETSLNGAPLGRHDFPWGTVGYDVTALIAARNEVVLRIRSDRATSNAARQGTLGCGEGGSTDRHPIGGILGDVSLAVESRALEVRRHRSRTEVHRGKGAILFSAEMRSRESTLELALSMKLDGSPVLRRMVTLDPEWRPVTLEAVDLEVAPWQPRRQGLPQLYDVAVACDGGGKILFAHETRTGFRPSFADAGEPYAMWPNQSFQPNFGEDPALPFDRWRLAQRGEIRVVGHLAPPSFYRLCDRGGLTIRQDVPLSSDLRDPAHRAWLAEALCRRSEHVSLSSWRLWRALGEEVDESAAEEMRALLAALDPVRPIEGP